MGINFLLDTNIIIYHLNGSEEYKDYFKMDFLSENNIYISSITKIELLSFADLTEDEELKIKNLINEFEIIPLISQIEDLCIKIRKKYKMKIPDSIILASAKYTKSELVTSDKTLQNIYKKISKK